MNILFFDNYFNFGGGQVVSQSLSKGFKDNGHNVDRISIKENPLTLNKFANYIKKNNVDIIINQVQGAKFCRNAIEQAKIKCKLISCHHNSIFSINVDYPSKNILKQLLKQLLKPLYLKYKKIQALKVHKDKWNFSDKYVLLSKYFVEEIKDKIPNGDFSKLAYMPNPLRYDFVEEIDLEKENKQNMILFVGRISEYQKRLSFILEIWKIILNTKKYNDWNLKIVGEGEDLEDIKRKAKGLDRVYFEGKQNPEPYFKEASIFFMTSSFEGFPMTLIETQSCGCTPIVMNSFSALKDIIVNNENGIISPNNDIDTFAKNTMLLMENTDLRNKMAKNAIESVKKFSIENIVEKWEKLFKELTK